MLGLDPSAEIRSEDSLKFEQKNSEWQYSVRSQELIPYTWRDLRDLARIRLTDCRG
jgi:hypothetical protein